MDVKESFATSCFVKNTYEKSFDSEKAVEESVVVGEPRTSCYESNDPFEPDHDPNHFGEPNR